MKILLTGATGYLGSAIARELTAAGHNVTGLARSATSARKLQAARVVPHSGSLADAGSLAAGARSADAVIHTALDDAAKAPHHVDIEAASSFLRALAGTGKAFVYTSGLTVLGDTGGVMADEDTPPNPIPFSAWRPVLEKTVLAAAGCQVRSIVIRPGWVYGHGGGAVRLLVEGARQDGIASPVGNGRNHWPVVHIDDIARLYVLAVEQAPADTMLHAVGTPAAPGRGYRRRSLPGRRRPGVCPATAAGAGSPATGPAGRRPCTRPACERRAGTAPARLGTGFTVSPRRTSTRFLHPIARAGHDRLCR